MMVLRKPIGQGKIFTCALPVVVFIAFIKRGCSLSLLGISQLSLSRTSFPSRPKCPLVWANRVHGCRQCRHRHPPHFESSFPIQEQAFSWSPLSASTTNEESSSSSSLRLKSRSLIAFRRFRCRVAYDGAGFRGFQIQSKQRNMRTVQGELESVLSLRFPKQNNNKRYVITSGRVVGAGRTDAGVHAQGQAMQFDLLVKRPNAFTMDNRVGVKTPNSTIENDENYDVDVSVDNDIETRFVDQNDGVDSKIDRETTIQQLNSIDVRRLQHSLNRMLPQDIRVWNLMEAPCAKEEFVNGQWGVYQWNVMRKAVGKLYSYRFSISSAMDPCERHTRWQIPYLQKEDCKFDVHVFQHEVLDKFKGTHDFACFAGAVEQNERKKRAIRNKDESSSIKQISNPKTSDSYSMNTIRTIQDIVIISDYGVHGDADNYRINVVLDGALYKMVRNIIGTAIDVYFQNYYYDSSRHSNRKATKIRLTPQEFNHILHPKDDGRDFSRKDNPCKPAPPEGLTLEYVFYDDKDEF